MGRRVIAVLAAAALVLTGCTRPQPTLEPAPTAVSTAPTRSVVFGPGADGLGDSYYPKAGNGGYDVASYDLDLRYDPKTDRLTGTATIAATATADLSRFNLDLKDLTTERVSVDGVDARAAQVGTELRVTPAAGIPKNSRFVVEVRYGGVPKPYRGGLGEDGFLHTDDGALVIGEPEVAASWFPVNDHPRDKATYAIRIAAPDGLAAVSNGALKDKTSADGWTTWTWSETKPMAPYLATVVIGKYRLKQSTHDGKPVVIAVDSSLPTRVDAQLARTPEIVDFLAARFGPYPFDAMGGIAIDDPRIRYALENQSRPIYSNLFFQAGNDATWVIAHELAHQWYGDSVSVNDWSEIWLNEGFATYGQWLWQEHNGDRAVQPRFDELYSQANAAMWRVPPGNPGAAALAAGRPIGDDEVFDNSVYDRGAMTLHALRVTIGDDAFFRILKAWAAEKANANATTPEFVAVAERISGKQLDRLFQDWLYGTKRPPRPTR